MFVRALVFASLALLAASCGSSGEPRASAPPPVAIDAAFLARIGPHQDTSLALAREASRSADSAEVQRLAKRMVHSREQLRPAVQTQLAAVPDDEPRADLGVSAAQAAEEIHADGLEGAEPVDAAFLTLMQRHDEGALALAKAERTRGSDPGVKALAQELSVVLAGELNRIRHALAALARASD